MPKTPRKSPLREIEHASESCAQKKFVRWAESCDTPWPEIDERKFGESVFDYAMLEGVTCYLKTKDIGPLREFLETSACLLSKHDSAKIYPSHKDLPPIREARRKVLKQLLQIYGFMGDFETAWRLCERSGLDTVTHNYLCFGLHSADRKFRAHQAFFFAWGTPPLTQVGMTHTEEIFPFVNDQLDRFEAREKKNLFDYYIDISTAIETCLEVGVAENEEFRARLLAVLKRFDHLLLPVFTSPAELVKAQEVTIHQIRASKCILSNQLEKFLSHYFYEVDRRGLPGFRDVLSKTYRDGKSQVAVPRILPVITTTIDLHIASIFRECENRFRQSLGLRGIGQGWVSEATLFALLRRRFPRELVVQHARPDWIAKQHLDVYFPRINVAVEYQGVQHRRAIAFFGGEAGLRVRKQLDSKKKALCEANGCLLIEVFPGDSIESIVELIKKRAEQALYLPLIEHEHSSIIDQIEPFTKPDSIPSTSKRPTVSSWKRHLGKSELSACARHGDVELILRLESEQAGLRTFRNQQKETLLLIACKEGNVETATALLAVGLDPNARDWRKASILSKICNRHGVLPRPEIIELLLKHGADPNLHGTLTPALFDRCGYALPMIGCAIDGFLDCAKILFECCGSVNQQQPKTLLTPLMCACHPFNRHPFQCRSPEMILWLIECGADVNARSRNGYSPMDFALGASVDGYGSHERSASEILKMLADAGARTSEKLKPVLEAKLSGAL